MAPSADPTGAALHQAGRGDEGAFARFYDLTAAMVHGIVVRVVRDPSMADEVTQSDEARRHLSADVAHELRTQAPGPNRR